MTPPIIIPITNRKEVNCIVQEGVIYCEKSLNPEKEIGIIFLSLAGIIIWFMFIFWVSQLIEKKWGIYSIFILLVIGFLCPLLVAGLLLI